MDWTAHALDLAAVAAPPGSRWRVPVTGIPRHLFVPRWWAARDGEWNLRVGEEDHAEWLAAAYRNWTLVTRIGVLHADQAEPDIRPEGAPTSSSTLPRLVVQMYRHASIDDRCTVLDVGTGSGYGTAVLCARLGDTRVTAIDVDPYLNSAAERRLAEIGFRPRIITGDATGPLDGEWDRIAAMVSVRKVPTSWLRALKSGGRLATTLTGMSVILTAEKQQDGSAIGRIELDQAMFMRTRTGIDYPPKDGALRERARTEDGEHVAYGRYPVVKVEEAWEVLSMLELAAPGIEHTYAADGDIRTMLMVHEDGSWARAEQKGRALPTVHQGGPRRLWDLLDEIRDYWLRHGSLPLYGAQVRITPDGTIHLQRGRWQATID
ncbi:methyltransferase domain-containing protein [Acrocarpospora catenulata]|uniref:methyltransferase domain-containing protein n=1 Tax=Acrocarpospora catenulata TaxID=2836182 RepID=UPI001BDAACC0|nr:methyltransferase domain-containing protein [Acrocarpospora catenulata]